MLDGIFTYQYEGCVKIVAPECLREKLLHHTHSSYLNGGHFSSPKTKKKLKHWAWKNLMTEVNEYVNQCQVCLARRPKRTITSLHPTFLREDAPNRPLRWFAVDLCGPLPLTTKVNRHLLSFVDYFSKYIIALLVPDTKASTFAYAFIKEVILIYGPPDGLTSDNATNFTAHQIQELYEALKIHKIYTTPCHSKSNGAIERTFRTFHDLISKYQHTRQSEWDDYVPPVAYAYNCSIHSATGETPYYLAMGREPMFPYNLIKLEAENREQQEQLRIVKHDDIINYKARITLKNSEATKAVQKALRRDAEQMKSRYDRKATNQDFVEGEKVMLEKFSVKPSESPKHADYCTGRYRIIKLHPGIPKVTIQSATDPKEKPRVVHFDQIKSEPYPIGEIQPNYENSDQTIIIPSEETAEEQRKQKMTPRSCQNFQTLQDQWNNLNDDRCQSDR